MPTAIAAGTGAGSATFTLTDGQRKTVTISPAAGDVPAPSGCYYILSKAYGAGANFETFLRFDAKQTPFNVSGNGTWEIERDTTEHPYATGLDLD